MVQFWESQRLYVDFGLCASVGEGSTLNICIVQGSVVLGDGWDVGGKEGGNQI